MEQNSVEKDWETVQSLFPARKSFTSHSWAFGVSSRLGRKRIAKLQQAKSSQALGDFLSSCDSARIKALRTYAAINLEQTIAAFRITIIVNVSIPLLFFTIVNQLFPGTIRGVYAAAFQEGGMTAWVQLNVLLTAFIALVIILLFAVASLNQARDIRHLIDLIAAERGIYFGLEDVSDLQSG